MPSVKMTPELVAQFRAEMHDGEPMRKKAERYPVTEFQLYRIRAGKDWKPIRKQLGRPRKNQETTSHD